MTDEQPSPEDLGRSYAEMLGEGGWEAEVPEAPPLPETEPKVPPAPLRILEALLFVGGPPLTSARVCQVIRGMTTEQPGKPKYFDLDGKLNDTRCIRVASTNASLFAYVADGRNGLRVGDISSGNFKEKYTALVEKHKQLLAFHNYQYNLAELEPAWMEAIEALKDLTHIDSEYFVNNALKSGKKVLAEGAQGSMLDIDFGNLIA